MISNLNSHPQFVCDICGKTYKHEKALIIHLGIHNGVSPFVCSICDKIFTQKVGIKNHLMYVHFQSSRFKCETCDRCFTHKKTYENHLKVHTGEQLYCSICNLGLNSSIQVQRHMRVHTKEKPFLCDICDKSFAQKFNLYAHKRVLHSNGKLNKKYSCRRQCPLCNSTYEKNKLSEHLLEEHAS